MLNLDLVMSLILFLSLSLAVEKEDAGVKTSSSGNLQQPLDIVVVGVDELDEEVAIEWLVASMIFLMTRTDSYLGPEDGRESSPSAAEETPLPHNPSPVTIKDIIMIRTWYIDCGQKDETCPHLSQLPLNST